MITMIEKAADYLRSSLPFAPEIGLILGSGIQPLANEIEQPIVISYADVPGMPHATAPGHIGQFVCGFLEGKTVICMQGRLHGYEGHSRQTSCFR